MKKLLLILILGSIFSCSKNTNTLDVKNVNDMMMDDVIVSDTSLTQINDTISKSKVKRLQSIRHRK
ncbi:hypothetical protein [Epilithonimonas arachidiradicis]|uniref:hypothetical protein n=1 Tax=Epilithonimonas arachidiradicis TaxID=1617282 RepID=UPI000E7320AB|nr:hypothetical protein [Epilithonimonas arachidiradicis]